MVAAYALGGENRRDRGRERGEIDLLNIQNSLALHDQEPGGILARRRYHVVAARTESTRRFRPAYITASSANMHHDDVTI